MSRATFYTQRVLASIRRRDGRTIDGTPGDCLRACAATVLGAAYADVPHFALYGRQWFDAMRIDARREGLDWACYAPETFRGLDGHHTPPAGAHVILSGPSPRGPWWHCVVGDRRGRFLHDPHPSRAGLEAVGDVLVLVHPYDPAPQLLQITTGAAPTTNDCGRSRPLEGTP